MGVDADTRMQFATESFGFLTSRGMAAWAVAGAAAYVYFVVPKQREEREVMVCLIAISLHSCLTVRSGMQTVRNDMHAFHTVGDRTNATLCSATSTCAGRALSTQTRTHYRRRQAVAVAQRHGYALKLTVVCRYGASMQGGERSNEENLRSNDALVAWHDCISTGAAASSRPGGAPLAYYTCAHNGLLGQP